MAQQTHDAETLNIHGIPITVVKVFWLVKFSRQCAKDMYSILSIKTCVNAMVFVM
jgi:hypothetical protein